MPLGVSIITRDAPPSRGAPTDGATWFVAGASSQGPIDRSVKVTSLGQFTRIFGEDNTDLANSIDLFFREGGAVVYVARAAGGSTVGSKTLNDGAGTPAPTLAVTSKYVGTYANSLRVAVIAGDTGGEYKLVISNSDGDTLETSPSLATRQDAVDWSENSSYVNVALTGSSVLDPAVAAAAALTGGTDDTPTDAELVTALALHVRDLGPGQVSIPGATSATIYTGLANHASDTDRVFLADAENTGTVGTLTTAAAALRAGGLGDFGGIFGPWVKVPTNVAGVARTIPPSAAVAALISRVDQAGNPNVAAAGRSWPLNYVTDLAFTFSDADRETLLDAGVNTFKDVYGTLELYGFQTVASFDDDPVFWQLNSARMLMIIKARSKSIGEQWMFRQISATVPAQFAAEISSMLSEYWTLGALYGDTPGQAFKVDWRAVNDADTIAAGELHAAASVRFSPHAKWIVIELISTPITQNV